MPAAAMAAPMVPFVGSSGVMIPGLTGPMVPNGNALVFPGDKGGAWTGIYGVQPMTQAYYSLSFTGSTAAKAFEYTRIDSSGNAFDTGSIYFVNGKIDATALTNLMGLLTDTGPVVPGFGAINPYYGTYEVRITKWVDQSANGNDLTQATLGRCPVLGVYKGQLYVFFGGHSLGCTLAAGSQLSTTGFTMIASCKPFASYNGFGGTIFYGDVITGSQSLGLINYANGGGSDTTSHTHWASQNTLLATPVVRAGLAAINRVSVSLTQSRSQTCEIGVGSQSTTYADVTGSTFTGTGVTLGSAASQGGGYFYGGVQGFMFAGAGAGGTSAWKDAPTTASVRSAMDAAFGIAPINETKNIIITGFSNNVGFSGYGIPQIKGWAGTGAPPLVAGWGQQLADSIPGNYRIIIVAVQLSSDFWGELTSRIPDVVAAYSSSATKNIHYFSPLDYGVVTGDPTPTGTTYVNHYQTYQNALTAALTGGKTLTYVCGGFSPIQAINPAPTQSDLNATLQARAVSVGYIYNPTVSDGVYNTAFNNATAGGTPGTGDEWRQTVDNHLTMIAASVIATQEGINLAGNI